jgi:hypothetical protein
MITTTSIPQAHRSRFLSAMNDWLHANGTAWIRIVKTVRAAIVALLVAMRLDLPAPRTTMTKAKICYHFIVTIVGPSITLEIGALFSQQPFLFLTAETVSVGVCTSGSAHNLNFRCYALVMAANQCDRRRPGGAAPRGAEMVVRRGWGRSRRNRYAKRTQIACGAPASSMGRGMEARHIQWLPLGRRRLATALAATERAIANLRGRADYASSAPREECIGTDRQSSPLHPSGTSRPSVTLQRFP